MRLFFGFVLTGLTILTTTPSAQACCGHKLHCHKQRQVCQTSVAPTYYQPATTASPQAYAAPQMAAAAAAPTALAAAPASGVQPAYNYEAAPTGQQAYYYTYDSSGKLVIAQWMDWVFRGGRAAGEPAPPLPIIGALRGR